MRKLTIILTSLLLVVGLGSCKKDNGVKGPNDNGSVTTEQNELPLLKFDPERDQNGNLTDKEILDYEKKLDRTPEVIDLGDVAGHKQIFPGFVNKNLTIPGVIYALSSGSLRIIVALSKESLADCPKTLEMLDKLGFKDIQDKQTQEGTSFKIGKKGDVIVQLSDDPVADLGSTLRIKFYVIIKD